MTPYDMVFVALAKHLAAALGFSAGEDDRRLGAGGFRSLGPAAATGCESQGSTRTAVGASISVYRTQILNSSEQTGLPPATLEKQIGLLVPCCLLW
jgi:hypothetical protein